MVLDDRPVLRGVFVDLAPGLAVLRGPNGAGKTTLLRALAGLAPLARGSRQASSAPLFIGERSMLLRGLSARQNLEFLAGFRGRRADVKDALGRFGLADVMDRPVERLSAGERHRASLARLLTEPEEIVLLDEPFAELDRDGVALVRDAIRTAVGAGSAVVVATHGNEDLDGYASASLLIRGGRLRTP
ncbi:MAG TPA: ATP-binding cassette domain-containing protein [Candidatus Limnocylindrales bacterium]|nr:ATP-binding cassette domain-containing protein [Candidatus Limnocylindrales bacterium]